MHWEPVIGLEIHAQLATRSKIFSGASTAYGAEPNTQACLVDLGYPGVLPVLNGEVVRLAVRFGLAIGAAIARRSVFARKNYFYPDLPKGYQISQYELPIVQRGSVQIFLDDGGAKTIGVTRAHLEEDAGKSLHENFDGETGIDLNRAGTPLLEIVSEPDMRSAAEAGAYMRKIHQLVRYLGISDGNMQEGSFRCDANVSVRPLGEEKLGTRAELKNLNSFRFVERAINIEIERQIDILEDGGEVVQETRLYDADRDETRPMRFSRPRSLAGRARRIVYRRGAARIARATGCKTRTFPDRLLAQACGRRNADIEPGNGGVLRGCREHAPR
jgi:aspartyl-tRNA(Asn)/glutamyl-tRNA(Gln) amidotransferase subunit B